MANYVDNKKFTKELGDWAKKVREGQDIPMSDYIGECIYLICQNKRYDRHFIGYANNDTMINEMIGDALVNCIKYCKNFDGDKFNNAYGYINRIAYFAFIGYIKKEKLRYLKHLKYVRSSFSDTDIKDALNADNPNDIKGYTMYTDQLLSILDDMDIELPEDKKRKTSVKKKGSIELIMTGEDY
jgi:hypothetical protein